VTLGWRLTSTAQDELFAAIEGTAFHTRVILERMEQHGVPVRRIINAAGSRKKTQPSSRLRQRVEQTHSRAAERPTSIGSPYSRSSRRTYRTVEEASRTLPELYDGRTGLA